MPITLAFDVYGTLIDTSGVTLTLSGMIGEQQAIACAGRWREKQLEYSFRRGLMAQYRPFPVCTRDALEFTCRDLDLPLTDSQKQTLMDSYLLLPAFPDVKPALEKLQPLGFRMYPFSNGTADDVRALLEHADLQEHFPDIVSVDEVHSFKPDPAVYHHFLSRSGARAEDCWLISGNPFDLLGAASCTMRTAWVKRNPRAVFDPWGIQPDCTVDSLNQLPSLLPRP